MCVLGSILREAESRANAKGSNNNNNAQKPPQNAPGTQATATTRQEGKILWDIRQTDTRLIFQLELPGVNRQDVSIKIDQSSGLLTVNAEKKLMMNTWHHSHQNLGKRCYGKLTFSQQLPTWVEPNSYTATLASGVLEIVFLKKTPKVEVQFSCSVKVTY